jgi:hypothetical protein
MIGEHVATPASNRGGQSAALSHANCCPISASESLVPMVVTMNLFPSIRASSSVPSGRLTKKTILEGVIS